MKNIKGFLVTDPVTDNLHEGGHTECYPRGDCINRILIEDTELKDTTIIDISR